MGRRPLGRHTRKRLLGLRMRVSREGDVGRRRAVRNALKVALPWELGHTAAFLLSDPKAGGSTVLVGMASAALAWALATGYVASLFLGAGRTPYDHRRQLGGPLTRSGNVRRDPVRERAVRKSLGPVQA